MSTTDDDREDPTEKDENDGGNFWLVKELMTELIDDVTLGLCFEVHRSCKLGTFFLQDMDPDSEKQYEIVRGKGTDVFGQTPQKKQYDCICPNCQRSLAASRFAPHLEKCMGMGRNSSRIARKRIATNRRRDSDNDSPLDDDNDNDWSASNGRKKKHKKEKRKHKSKSIADIPSVGSTNSDLSTASTYEAMSLEERKARLLTFCGVVSETNKKICNRNLKCNLHSDEQRSKTRTQWLVVVDSLAEPWEEDMSQASPSLSSSTSSQMYL